MGNWAKFDVSGLVEEMKTLKDDNEFKEVPLGKYEVEIVDMVLKPTKEKGNPMLAVQFKILAGDFKNSRLFMNQVLINGDQYDKFRVSTCNKFLKSLESQVEIVFESVDQYESMVDEVFHEVNASNLEYLLEYGENKGYKTFTIKEVYR